MLDGPTIEKLKEMRLKVMAQMLSDPDENLKELSFEDRLALMVERQWLEKRNARIKRLTLQAGLSVEACI
jgi:hypothetical protein